jgi:hypothetical protein
MEKSKKTITGGMGLKSSFVESAQEIIKKSLKKTSYVSDALLDIAEKIREDSLGEVYLEISEYEKKLIFIGFIAGEMRASSQIAGQIEMLKYVEKISDLEGFMDFLGKQKDED